MRDINRREFMAASAAATGWVTTTSGAQSGPPPPPSLTRSAIRTLIRGADLLTLDAQQRELPAVDVLMDGGKIVAIGKKLEAADAYVIDAHGMVLMPGLVDGYRHVWQVLQIGELVHTEPARIAQYERFKSELMVCLTPADHHLAGLIGGLQAIDAGVTTLLDYADVQYQAEGAVAAAQGLKASGVNGWFAYQVSKSPSHRTASTVSWAAAEAERLAFGDDVHFDTVAQLQRTVFSDHTAALRLGICVSPGILGAPMSLVRREFERIRAQGVQLIVAPVSIPARPFAAGHFGSMDSGIQDLAAAGLLGPDLHFVHGNDLTQEELAYLKAQGGSLCSAVLEEFVDKMKGRRGSVHGRARAAGVAVGIGSGSGLALPLDFFEHLRASFWNLQLDSDSEQISDGYTSEDTLRFATRGGAEALRLEKVTGAIETGRWADLLLLRTDRFGFGTLGSLADRVVNFACQSDIDSVWVQGRLKKAGGRLLGADIRALSAQLQAVQSRLERAMKTIRFT
jgi:cytosine/adenosine deaminase-related metal-dependent hydrolase